MITKRVIPSRATPFHLAAFAGIAIAATTSPSAAVVPEFRGLTDQLLDVNAIAMSASLQIIAEPGAQCCDDDGNSPTLPDVDPAPNVVDDANTDANAVPLRATGWMEYVAINNNYRASVHANETVVGDFSTDVAYDGATYYYVDHRHQRAALEAGPDRGLTGMMIAPPIFAAHEYLLPTSSENVSLPHLPTLRDEAFTRSDATNIVWNTETIDGVAVETTTVDLSQTHAHDEFDLTIYRDPAQPSLPTKFERVDPSTNTRVATTTLSHYQTYRHADGSTSTWPLHIEHQIYDANGVAMLRLSWVITSLHVGTQEAARTDRLDVDIPAGFKVYNDGVFSGIQPEPAQ